MQSLRKIDNLKFIWHYQNKKKVRKIRMGDYKNINILIILFKSNSQIIKLTILDSLQFFSVGKRRKCIKIFFLNKYESFIE